MISLIIKDFNNYNEIISNNNLQRIYDNQMAKVDYLTSLALSVVVEIGTFMLTIKETLLSMVMSII